MSIQGFVMSSIQAYRYQDMTINLTCKRCHYKGKHKFACMCPSTITMLTWGLGWTKKLFKCEKCGVLMYENGEMLVTIFDRVEGFIHYPEMMQTIIDLEFMIADNQSFCRNKKLFFFFFH